MMEDKIKIQTVSIREDQFEFLEKYREENKFNFSKFIRDKLDEWIVVAKEVEDAKRIE